MNEPENLRQVCMGSVCQPVVTTSSVYTRNQYFSSFHVSASDSGVDKSFPEALPRSDCSSHHHCGRPHGCSYRARSAFAYLLLTVISPSVYPDIEVGPAFSIER